ncbi:MAG: MgtC/SapB family protein [Spirochaetaceae bacterium]|jgi:putative Mg2+ transporter-C (MgtC) family protein|nr:MgtC/SapB family protein [Spirochaetaceae bacterium]
MLNFDPAVPLTELDVVFRLVLSFLVSACIGAERSSRHQIAGMRTHILIALGATFLMCLSIWLPQMHPEMKNGDPGRIAAQVVSGIGFLGAGAMIRLGTSIRGLTTATSLWITAAIGLGMGAGMFFASIAAALLGLIALRIIDVFERRFFPQERTKAIDIFYHGAAPNTELVLSLLRKQGMRIHTVDIENRPGDKQTCRLSVLVSLTSHPDISLLEQTLKNTGEIERIESKEKY